MKPSQILFATAVHIETYGWSRNRYVARTVSKPADKCPVCPRGGMSVAVGHAPTFAVDYSGWGQRADRDAFEEVSAAEKAFAEYLGRRGLVPSEMVAVPEAIEWWNDKRAESAEQVVKELRACGDELRAGGQ